MEVVDHCNEDNLQDCSKEELIEKVRKLQIHVKQLRNVIVKKELLLPGSTGHLPSKRQKREGRAFNFSEHPQRHILLKFAYLGWDYQGLACQEDTDQTIEDHLFKALYTTRLIECRSTSNYNRCGRTDKGVSAFSQAISIDVRCKASEGLGVKTPEGYTGTKINLDNDLQEEIDYCKLLNRVLPKDIRVTAWAPVAGNFSARFDCNKRTYRYFLPLGDLDIQRMQEASQYLIGEHDFQNFCKLDTTGEKTTVRKINSVQIDPIHHNNNLARDGYELVRIEICGQSFVWHQIRCIVAVLILVGKRQEDGSVIKDLLDLQKHPKKPQYPMAVDFPLVLFDVSFNEDINWVHPEENCYHTISDFQGIWAQHAIKAQMILDMMEEISKMTKIPKPIHNHVNTLTLGTKPKVYTPLLERPVCERARKKVFETP